MAVGEQKLIKDAETLYYNGEIEKAVTTLGYGLKDYPNNNAIQDLLYQYRNIKVLKIPDDFQQEVILNQHQSMSKLDQETNNHELQQEIDPIKHKYNENIKLIENNIFQIRLNVLIMEQKVVNTFYAKKVIANDNDTFTKMNIIKMYVNRLNFDTNNNDQVKNALLTAENISTELMNKIKEVVKIKTVKKEEVNKPEDDIEDSNYRSIVTVRGTREDVKHCILKAQTALENGKYDRAEKLLLKAERIIPTKNARDLLKQVRAAKEMAQNAELNEKCTEAVEIVSNTVKEEVEQSNSEVDSINTAKYLTHFKQDVFDYTRFDPSCNVEKNGSLHKAATHDKTKEAKRQMQIEKAIEVYKTPGDCLFSALKAYDAGDFLNVQEILLKAMTLDPLLNLEVELTAVRAKIASKVIKVSSDVNKTWYEETVSGSNIKRAAESLYDAKKSYDASDFIKAEERLIDAKTVDPSLNLEPFFSKCRAAVVSRSSTERMSSTAGINLTDGMSSTARMSLMDESIISESATLLHTERNKADKKHNKKKIKKEDIGKSNTIKKLCISCIILLIVLIVFLLIFFLA